MENQNSETGSALRRTPLHELHAKLGARMVPFAGYEMPVQYPAGIMSEHRHTREHAGLFDVSHMGQLIVDVPGGGARETALALEALIPADIVGLGEGRQRYGLLTNDAGGIEDDLMVQNLGDRYLLIVNAATKEADEKHLRERLASSVRVTRLENALIALQGPEAEAALSNVWPECRDMRFMDVREAQILGHPCIVSRSGYTGEDGFEISIPNDGVNALAEALLAHEAVQPIGLGARDSLRLEAGLCLYGSDIDTETTPCEAQLKWSIPKVRRTGGERAGGFPGSDVILQQFADGTDRERVGLRPEGKAPVRGGAKLFADESDQRPIGEVTSGGFGPSVGAPVAMGYLASDYCAPGTRVFADVRGKYLPIVVSQLPFIVPSYKRT